jgi:hypothetical protein
MSRPGRGLRLLAAAGLALVAAAAAAIIPPAFGARLPAPTTPTTGARRSLLAEGRAPSAREQGKKDNYYYTGSGDGPPGPVGPEGPFGPEGPEGKRDARGGVVGDPSSSAPPPAALSLSRAPSLSISLSLSHVASLVPPVTPPPSFKNPLQVPQVRRARGCSSISGRLLPLPGRAPAPHAGRG